MSSLWANMGKGSSSSNTVAGGAPLNSFSSYVSPQSVSTETTNQIYANTASQLYYGGGGPRTYLSPNSSSNQYTTYGSASQQQHTPASFQETNSNQSVNYNNPSQYTQKHSTSGGGYVRPVTDGGANHPIYNNDVAAYQPHQGNYHTFAVPYSNSTASYQYSHQESDVPQSHITPTHGNYNDDSNTSYRAYPHMPSRRDDFSTPTATMWVGGLDPEITESDLRECICRYGNPEKVTRLTERGMAFVHFSSTEECTLVMQSLKGVTIKGYPLRLNYGKPLEAKKSEHGRENEDYSGGTRFERHQPRENPATNVLWLGGLQAEHTEERLYSVFAELEGLQDVNVHGDKGCAFIQFRDVAQTIVAKEFLASQLNNTIFNVVVKVNFGKHMQVGIPSRRGNLATGGPPPGLLMPKAPTNEQSNYNYIPTQNQHQLVALPAPTLLTTTIQPPSSALNDSKLNETNHVSTNNLTYSGQTQKSFFYYENCEDRGALTRGEVDRLVCLVDEARRDGGRETLRDHLKTRQGNAAQALRVVEIRLRQYFSRDPHKKLIVLYAVFEFILGSTSPAVVCTSIGADLEVFVSTVAENQCEQGKKYISNSVRCLTPYCEPHIRDAIARYIVLSS